MKELKKSLDVLEFSVPHLGVQSARNVVGGCWCSDGYLHAAYCTASSGGGMSWAEYSYWQWLFSHDNDNNDPDYGGGGGSGSGGGDYSWNYGSGSGDHLEHNVGYNGYSFDGLSDDAAAKFTEVMESLPERLQQQTVTIKVDSAFLDSICDKNGWGEGSIKGAFFHKGQKLSDGTIVETDMIVLYSVDNAQEVLWEESLHKWQYHNNILNGARQTSTIVACEEVQADIIQALVGYAEGTRWTSITGRAASDSGFREMAERAFNKETGFYDTDIIMEYINSSQGIITDKDWNYNWECVLNMFVGQPFSQTNGNNGY